MARYHKHFPALFEEKNGPIAVDIIDSFEVEVHFSDFIKPEAINPTEIVIDDSTGSFTDEQINALKGGVLNYIVYHNQMYQLNYRNKNIYKYFAKSEDVNSLSVLTVDLEAKTWVYEKIVNGVLISHINDDERHVTSADRNFWDNKLNYDSVNNECLIFNKN